MFLAQWVEDVGLIVKLEEDHKKIGGIMKNKFFIHKKSILGVIILVSIIMVTSCSDKADMQSKNNNNLVYSSNTSANNTDQILLNNSNIGNSLPPSSIFEVNKEESSKGLKQIREEIYSRVFNISKAAGLPKLNNEKFFLQDKEIRLWVIDETMSINGFVYTYKQEQNLALKVYAASSKNELSKSRLNKPKSGWENWSKYLEKQEFLFNKYNKTINSAPDTGFFVVETKTSQDYASKIFSLSKTDLDNNQIINLCTKIREEFNINFFC